MNENKELTDGEKLVLLNKFKKVRKELASQNLKENNIKLNILAIEIDDLKKDLFG